MLYVGIDIASKKHDCAILEDGKDIPTCLFTINNNKVGFVELCKKIRSLEPHTNNIRIGVEATGHYEHNLLGYLLKKGYNLSRANPLMMKRYKDKNTLRKTKTDKVDATCIAKALREGYVGFNPYTTLVYHNDEIKSLTRYKRDLIRERATCKTKLARIIGLSFPELKEIFPTLSSPTVCRLLAVFPSAQAIANADLTIMSNILNDASRGHFGIDMARKLKELAKNSIGEYSNAVSLEIKHLLSTIGSLSSQILEVNRSIQDAIAQDDMLSGSIARVSSIPGVSKEMAAEILAEIGDVNLFSSPDKILAFAGCSPSTYQSGELSNGGSRLEKRGSRNLRYALFMAAKSVCVFDPTFAKYLAKKRSTGKHYYCAVCHAVKKLVRVIYSLETRPHIYQS